MFRDQKLARFYRRLPRSAFRPLRITAWLGCGVAGDYTALPFDSILYYQAHREALGPIYVATPGSAYDNRSEGMTMPLPIARCEEHTPKWYYAASFAVWPQTVADGVDHWNKRFDIQYSHLIDFGKRKATVNISSGHYKAYHMPLWYRHALWVRWYVLGEPERIRELLSCCTHIGKKTSQGWGSVLRWEVEEWHSDWSVRRDDGQLMRAIPAAEGIVHGFRPSYWLPEHQTVCAVPGDIRE